MSQLSPYDPEIETLWRAIASAGARSVAVVSCLPGEGATLIASALARRAGLGGLPSLLVDLDLVRPGVARLLGLRPHAGEIVRINALGMGVLPDADSAAVTAWREPTGLRAQVDRWSGEYGLVVFDTAPVLSRGHEPLPATAAAAAAEATVLVVMSGRTPVPAIREAQARLEAVGARLLGTVMNDRDNPSLLAELERQTHRGARRMPRTMAALRARLQRMTLLTVRV